MMACPHCDEQQGRGECDDHPIISMDMLSDWFWSAARCCGVIGTLMAILWFLGKVH